MTTEQIIEGYRKEISDLMVKYESQISSLTAEVEQLRQWKESALAVAYDPQAVGKLLGVGLGQSVHDKVVPGIKALQAEVERLKGTLEPEWKHEEPFNYDIKCAVFKAVESFKDKNLNFTRDYLRPALSGIGAKIIATDFFEYLLASKRKLEAEKAQMYSEQEIKHAMYGFSLDIQGCILSALKRNKEGGV